jgi:SagB-type dehydrogenase family enzyme
VGSGQRAGAYHQATKHSWESVRRGGRALDWENRPRPFKAYRGVEKIDLPRYLPGLEVRAMDALAGSAGRGEKVPARPPTAEDLSRLLQLGAGAHRRMRFPDGEVVHFRTYASAGALYPNEAYLVCGDLPGLPEGVYHYDPLTHALDRLRPGDHRGNLVRACAGEPAVVGAPATLVVTGIPWRTGWKYGDRGYRHLFWDAGMIVANVLAVAAAEGFGARVVLGFADGEIEALIGLDPRREFPLCLVPVGEGQPVQAGPQPPEAVAFEEEPASAREDRFPAIREVNDAGRLADPRAVQRWRAAELRAAGQAWPQPVVVEPAPPPPDPLDRVILRRGSARDFGPGSMPAEVLAAILAAATGGVPTDLVPTGERLPRVFLVANAVPGLPTGALAYQDHRFHLLRAGEFRRKAAFMCLEQRLAADAAAACFLLSDLDRLLRTVGDRGYRVAQLEAGIVAGRLYLGAYAFGYGASGLTFYDDEVTQFFAPEAATMECMLVVCAGESMGRSDLRPIR